MEVKLSIAWNLGRDQATPIGTSLIPLLRSIDELGSLSKAAKSLNISYRNAWNLVNRWADELEQPLVAMERGRGASLSSLGKKLLWAETYTQSKTTFLLNEIAEELRVELGAAQTSIGTKRIMVFASHCLTHQCLKEIARKNAAAELTIKNAGSARALSALANGKCLAAGFHLPEGELRSDLITRYRRDIDPKRYTLIHALTRKQGLILARGNPCNIFGIEDLTKPGLRFVNRQTNSGTRLLLDCILKRQGVNAANISGYDVEEFTHSAVSALIASGSVDAGVGTQASAEQLDLEFISLANESYFYAVANDDINTTEIKILIKALASKTFRESAKRLAGYSADNSGNLIPADSVLYS